MSRQNFKSFVLAVALLVLLVTLFFYLGRESPEEIVIDEVREEVYYTMTLPLCSSSTVLMLDQEEVVIWCEDRADFQIEISEDLVEKLEAIKGISNVHVGVKSVHIEQDGNYYWIPLLQEAFPILVAALEENQ